MNGIVLGHTEWRDKGRGAEGGSERMETAKRGDVGEGRERNMEGRERRSGGSLETEEKWEAGRQGRPRDQRLVNKRMDGADRRMLNGARGHLISSYGFYQDWLAEEEGGVFVSSRGRLLLNHRRIGFV